MEAPNLGPDWFWKALFAFGCLGAIAFCCGVVYGIYWLATHVSFN